ncbi:hypothetical protein CERSUDRAFT_100861 [Gelatoporia subvermispora B]|uniref:Uncharacterized protein n=1 Tax=Ceriporiopsis subvermispora (strain B) TaxID=914234 RepID=M2QG10_CERS8|nr:hypothetical protein CERSUDRAFT_100861 [Gelatoporia subvermispora B]
MTDQDVPLSAETPRRNKSKSPLTRKRYYFSDSDRGDDVPPPKSPRKSRRASPKSSQTITPTRGPGSHRAGSPSPLRAHPGGLQPRAAQTFAPKKRGASIISISSDSREPDTHRAGSPSPLRAHPGGLQPRAAQTFAPKKRGASIISISSDSREPDTHRAGSPSPLRAHPRMLQPRTMQTIVPKKRGASIISLSSDSEHDAALPAKSSNSPIIRRQVLAYGLNDIIDLT